MTFDAAGEVVSVQITESRFTRDDVALLLASRRDEFEPRGSHGHKLAEAIDPAHEFDWSVEPPIIDFAASAIAKAKSDYKAAMKNADIEYDESTRLWATKRTDLGG